MAHLLHEWLFLPASDLVGGYRVASDLRFLRRSRGWTREQINEFQDQRLRMLIEHAATKVPFYRDFFRASGLKPSDIRGQSDLQKLPIVDKAAMKKEGMERFVAEGFPAKKRIVARSSGSTGQPFTFLVSKEAYSMNMAAKLLAWEEAGYRIGDRYAKLSMRNRLSAFKRWQDRVNSCLYLQLGAHEEGRMEEIVRQMQRFRPTIVRGYPSSMLLLSRYVVVQGGLPTSPRCLMTTGEVLHESTRKALEEAFGCPVLDAYSCEGTACAAQREPDGSYLLAEEYGITELLDADGNPTESGEGRVVSTDLWNFAHPFIRYDTHDRATFAPMHDGRKALSHIGGRDGECLIEADGGRLSTQSISIFFTAADSPFGRSAEAYQVVKRKDGSILFRVEPSAEAPVDLADRLKAYWQPRFDQRVEVELIGHMPLTEGGKWLHIVEEK